MITVLGLTYPSRSSLAKSSLFCSKRTDWERVKDQPKKRTQDCSQNFYFATVRGEEGTETGQCIYDTRHATQDRGDAADHDGLKGNMMDDVRLFSAIDRRNVAHGSNRVAEGEAAARPVEFMKGKTLGSNAVTVNAHPRRNADIEAGPASCPRHWQTMRPKIPVLRYKENNLRITLCHIARNFRAAYYTVQSALSCRGHTIWLITH